MKITKPSLKSTILALTISLLAVASVHNFTATADVTVDKNGTHATPTENHPVMTITPLTEPTQGVPSDTTTAGVAATIPTAAPASSCSQ